MPAGKAKRIMPNIFKITSDPVVDFAAEELKKYLRMMMPRSGEYVISYCPGAKEGFRLGVFPDFGLSTEEVEDAELDDVLHVDTDLTGGIIAGSNPRSVLLSVYQYLRLNGCRWLFPGLDGEFIPIRDVQPTKYHKKPDMRYRAQCNEGAETQQSMLDTIDFTPKIGMNTYMLEFDIPFVYYNRYYAHRSNPEREPEPVSTDTVLQWKRVTEAEMAKRGLRLFDMGHGWTAESFGISSVVGWDKQSEDTIPEHMRQYLAEYQGKRQLYHGVALNTQICMSNPEARALVVRHVVEYAKQSENVHCLKIGLADASKNHCECEACRRMRPSDWLLLLLNEAEEALDKEGLHPVLGFSIYSDTTWEPEQITLKHPDRFLGAFCPISRKYTMDVPTDPHPNKITPYVRNVSGRLDTMEEYLWHYQQWKQRVPARFIVYEYHFWKAQYYSPDCLTFAKRLHDDVIAYHKNGFLGIMEDMSQRHFFPNALAFSIYAETMYDLGLDLDQAIDDYFSHAYGDAKEIVKQFFTDLSKLLPQAFLDTAHSLPVDVHQFRKPEMIPLFEEAIRRSDRFDEDMKPFRNMPYRVQTVAVRLLGHYTDYLRGFLHALIIKAGGDDEGAKQEFLAFSRRFGARERDIEPYYDHCLTVLALNVIFNSKEEQEM